MLVDVKYHVVVGFLFCRWKIFVSSLLNIPVHIGRFLELCRWILLPMSLKNNASMFNDQRPTTWLALNTDGQILDSILLLHCIHLGARKIVHFFRPPKMECETRKITIKIAVDSQILKLPISLWQRITAVQKIHAVQCITTKYSTTDLQRSTTEYAKLVSKEGEYMIVLSSRKC